jgi:anti-anti-sigma factor
VVVSQSTPRPSFGISFLRRFTERRLENLVIDLSDVPYVDLSGVARLLETLRVARSRNTGLQLRGLHDRPRYLLEVTGLLSLFETCGINVRSIQKAQ